jgi:hypothetical protein
MRILSRQSVEELALCDVNAPDSKDIQSNDYGSSMKAEFQQFKRLKLGVMNTVSRFGMCALAFNKPDSKLMLFKRYVLRHAVLAEAKAYTAVYQFHLRERRPLHISALQRPLSHLCALQPPSFSLCARMNFFGTVD